MSRDFNDYLGACGLDHEGQIDPQTGETMPATWQPVGDSDEFGRKVVERFKRFRQTIETNGLLDTWRRNYRQYYNGPATVDDDERGWGWSDSFQITGENGEVLGVRLPEPRTNITRMANLACSTPVALNAVAENSTPEALEAAQIANAVLREDFNPTQGGEITREAVELALAIGVGFIDQEWDQFAGEAYVPTEDGGAYYSGKPIETVRMPDEVCFDITKRKWRDVLDCIVLQKGNRYMLAKQIPDQAEKILSVPTIHDSEHQPFRYDDEDTDDIVVFRYMHKAGNRSFLPHGRLALVLEDGTVLRDGDNPYALVDPTRIGIFPVTAGSSLGSVYGYATMDDLSPLSQWLNVMASMAATIVAGYGAPNLTGPNMQAMQIQNMVGGGRYFGTLNGDHEIKPLHLLDDSALKAILEVMQMCMDLSEKYSGTSGLARDPGDGDSGKKAALMASLAVQFMSRLQQSIIATAEQRGTNLIRMRQNFSTAEEVAEISAGNGPSQKPVNYRANETFKRVARVRADAVDPSSQTVEGRRQIAREMFEMGAFQNKPSAVYDYITFIKTGQDGPLYADYLSADGLMHSENQMIMHGEVPTVLVGINGVGGDDHQLHIAKHSQCLNDPTARDPQSPVAQAALEHIVRHQMAILGAPLLQGVDPTTGQEYPPATEQFAQWSEQQAIIAEQQAAQQAQMSQTAPSKAGAGTSTPQPAQGGDAASPSASPPATALGAMEQAAMGGVG
jgi:hypothetical protein